MKAIENSPINAKALLNLFVADEQVCRPMLETPIEQDGYVYATDTHIAIRIPKEKIPVSYEVKDKPLFARVFPKSDPKFTIAFDDIEKAIDKCHLDKYELYETCPDCGGGGNVDWEYIDTNGQKHFLSEECPVCDGEGKARSGEFVYIGIANKAFSAHYLIRLLKAMIALETDVIKVTPNYNNGWLLEPCEGVEIALMPTIINISDVSSKIKTNKI